MCWADVDLARRDGEVRGNQTDAGRCRVALGADWRPTGHLFTTSNSSRPFRTTEHDPAIAAAPQVARRRAPAPPVEPLCTPCAHEGVRNERGRPRMERERPLTCMTRSG